MKLAVIGAGNMGGAIVRTLSRGPFFKPSDITCTAKSSATLERILQYERDIRVTLDNREAVQNADMVMFAVKPWLMETVLKETVPYMNLSVQKIVSIAAGITFAQISGWTGNGKAAMFRVIPNTAIEFGCGVTFISSCNATETDKELMLKIFHNTGHIQYVEESMMEAGTALASCGIAYAMEYIRAAAECGNSLGFSPSQAAAVVANTVKGAAELLLATGSTPEHEISKVTTPGGMTMKGLEAMKKSGFSQAVADGIKASMK